MGLGVSTRLFRTAWTNPGVRRLFSYTIQRNSGHNRWSKIRHDKAKEDAVKSKERTILSQEIILASKYGGPDPALNSRLATAIASAKRGQLSKSSIDVAIARGQGKSLGGAALESVTIEAMLPFGVAAILEYQTDSKARILSTARYIVKESGGHITPTTFLFDRKGKIWFEPKEGVGMNEAMDAAIEAGADDIAMEDGQLVVETPPSDVTSVAEKLLTQLQLTVHKMEILFEPKQDSLVELSDAEGTEIQRVMESFEEEPNLQALYINATIK